MGLKRGKTPQRRRLALRGLFEYPSLPRSAALTGPVKPSFSLLRCQRFSIAPKATTVCSIPDSLVRVFLCNAPRRPWRGRWAHSMGALGNEKRAGQGNAPSGPFQAEGDIGLILDPSLAQKTKLLESLARPTGLEPVFPP